MATDDTSPIPILDSHIHLYPASELSSLAWYTGPDHPLASQKSPEIFRATVAAASTGSEHPRPIKGAIFVETDRKHDISVSPPDYSGPLAEISWLRRIVEGTPREGEGQSADSDEDKGLLSAIVLWAPVPLGAEALVEYLQQAEKIAGPATWKRVKGFRYLLQDKPLGTGLQPNFIEALKELGRRGYAFDVGVDLHRRGKKQVDEAVEMIEAAHEGVAEEERVTFILNHLLKPDFSALHPADPGFVSWKSALYLIGKNPKVYMKLSGGFAEMSDLLRATSPSQIFQGIMPWLIALLASFGPRKIMFGSDWPVCTVGLEKSSRAQAPKEEEEDGIEVEKEHEENAWGKWRDVVEKVCYMASMDRETQEWVWYKTAFEAYKIEE